MNTFELLNMWKHYIYWRDHGNHCNHVVVYYGYLLNRPWPYSLAITKE